MDIRTAVSAFFDVWTFWAHELTDPNWTAFFDVWASWAHELTDPNLTVYRRGMACVFAICA